MKHLDRIADWPARAHAAHYRVARLAKQMRVTRRTLERFIESRFGGCLKSFDGLEIPCFWFQPVHSGSERRRLRFPLHRRARQPVVIFLPPRTGQFQRSFDARAQLLANLGFHFVAINYRGCDGYGRDYASLGSAEDAAQGCAGVV